MLKAASRLCGVHAMGDASDDSCTEVPLTSNFRAPAPLANVKPFHAITKSSFWVMLLLEAFNLRSLLGSSGTPAMSPPPKTTAAAPKSAAAVKSAARVLPGIAAMQQSAGAQTVFCGFGLSHFESSQKIAGWFEELQVLQMLCHHGSQLSLRERRQNQPRKSAHRSGRSLKMTTSPSRAGLWTIARVMMILL